MELLNIQFWPAPPKYDYGKIIFEIAASQDEMVNLYPKKGEEIYILTKAEILNKAKELIDVNDEKLKELRKKLYFCMNQEWYAKLYNFISSLFEEE